MASKTKTRYTVWFNSKRYGWMPLQSKFHSATDAAAWLDGVGRCRCWEYVISETEPENEQ